MNEEAYNSFESYLNNEMSTEERLDFESKLQDDSQFRESFELYKETSAFLEHKFSAETQDFKKNLASVSKDYFSEEEEEAKVISFKPWYYAVAASVVILLGTWIFMKGPSPEYGDYDQHENASFVERGDADENLKNAQDFFNKKEYGKAVVSFQKIQSLDNPEHQYFYAIALIETDNYVKAEMLLNEIQHGTSVYKNKAIWYSALSELKQKNMEECKSLLRQIPEDSEDYDKAQELLKELD